MQEVTLERQTFVGLELQKILTNVLTISALNLRVFTLFLLAFCCRDSVGASNYYSDPVTGSMTNTGSFNAPWASLSSIFAANKTFQAGDTIFLRTGDHGYALIRGEHTGYVTIMPQPGQSPVISRIRVSASQSLSASYWNLYHLTVQSEDTNNTATPAYYLIEIYPFAHHITIRGCEVGSSFNTANWTRDDWRNRCNNGIFTRGKLNAYHVIEDNHIVNTAFGLSVASSDTRVRNNVIEYFTNDGVRVLGSRILFEHNQIKDHVKVMTVLENHDDIFQSFTYAAGGTGQDTLKSDTIRNNLLICTTDTARAFVGPAQGMGCFDGVFLDWVVENNIVLTDHWHGISLYGAVNCKVLNNTVLDPYLVSPIDPFDNNSPNIGPTWITINQKTNGPPSSGNLVQNNLVAGDVIFVNPTVGVSLNNIKVGPLTNFGKYFVGASDFGKPGQFDLHLKSGCAAIDAGKDMNAPLLDFEGTTRPQGLHTDIGAYEYLGATSVSDNAAASTPLVFPNPFDSDLQVWCEPTFQGAEFQVFNAAGVLLHTSRLATGLNRMTISGLPNGLYIWKIRVGNSEGKVVMGKLVKG